MSYWKNRLLRHGLAWVGVATGLTLTALQAQANTTGNTHAAAYPRVSQIASDERVAEADKVTRAELLARAKGWLTANGGKPVPYSMTKIWKDGYRQDCSGYVSMAAKLPKAGGGPNTVGLFDTYTVPIAVRDMQPGDLFIDKDDRPGADFRHVVIFEKWADAARTQYWAYEQRGGHGTTYRKLAYGLKPDDYKPRRLKNITA
ncbi:hypothetical protein ACQPZF_32225 [Actinosynnema sp. CS-041913]|uniref:hypothetical protein n=1 Tax=Actinosynnema sp. CS-041913 TaxID=3239917 RepID=UPI003D914A2E